MRFSKFGPAIEPWCELAQFMGWCQAQVATGEIQAGILRQAPQAARADLFEHLLQQFPMTQAVDPVQDDTCQLQARVKRSEAGHQSGE